jgi:hypothetical protein
MQALKRPTCTPSHQDHLYRRRWPARVSYKPNAFGQAYVHMHALGATDAHIWSHTTIACVAAALRLTAQWWACRQPDGDPFDRLRAHQRRLPRLKIPNSAFKAVNVQGVTRRRALSLPMAITRCM